LKFKNFKRLVTFLTILAVCFLIIPTTSLLFADSTSFPGIGDSNYPGVYCGYGEHILFHFDVTGVDLNTITSASLTISANDVDEEAGEIDNVYFNEHLLGHLSGEDNLDSTTVFTIEPGWIVDGQNDVRVEPSVGPSSGWLVTVNWGQLFVITSTSGGTEPDATITGYSIVDYDNSGSDVVVNTTMNILARVAGTYKIEANLIDPNSNNIGLFTATVTATQDNQTLTQQINFTYPKSSVTGTYVINGLLFSNTLPPVLLSQAQTSFEHEEDTGLTKINEDEDTPGTVVAVAEEVQWIRDRDMTCFQVWVNADNNFEFVFWWEYKNNNWVKIYDMEGNEVFFIDMPYGAANFEANLPDGIYTVKTFHDGFEDPIQEFIIGKS